MKNAVIQYFVAVICVVLASSCGGESVGTKIGKEFCECVSEAKNTPIPQGEISFIEILAPMGCFGEIAEKYKEHFDFEGESPKFKKTQDTKDFEAVVKKCALEHVLPGE